MWLKGVRVLDLTRLLPGPYATMILADLGAEVIKVEPPKDGDYLRELMPEIFNAVNRNKKSICIDLKHPKGREVFIKLAGTSDVIVEQFRPGVAKRLGIGYDEVVKVNPEIIYCSITGFGQEGDYKHRVGHDLNYIALAGLLDLTRDDKGKPVIPGFPIADLAGGLFATISIVGALLRRFKEGKGDYIDVSLAGAVVALSIPFSSKPLRGKEMMEEDKILLGTYPCYSVYKAKDGNYVTLAALEEKFWREFCLILGREDLMDKRFDKGIKAEIENIFLTKTSKEWDNILKDREVMFAPLLTLKQSYQDKGISLYVDDVNGDRIVKLPIKCGALKEYRYAKAPKKGEHTIPILESLGYGRDEIEDMHLHGIVKSP